MKGTEETWQKSTTSQKGVPRITQQIDPVSVTNDFDDSEEKSNEGSSKFLLLPKGVFQSRARSNEYYPEVCQQRILMSVIEGLANEEGIIVCAGNSGLGKTNTLLQLVDSLLERKDLAMEILLLVHCRFATPKELFQAIHFDLKLPYEGKSEQELRLSLSEYLYSQLSAGKRFVLLLDEAHLLPDDLLDELRLLTNLEGAQGKAFQVVLVGQYSLIERLEKMGETTLTQRIAIREKFCEWSAESIRDYLYSQFMEFEHQLSDYFTEEAIDLLVDLAQGNPRRANQLAFLSYRMSKQVQIFPADFETVLEVSNYLGGDSSTEDQENEIISFEPVHSEINQSSAIKDSTVYNSAAILNSENLQSNKINLEQNNKDSIVRVFNSQKLEIESANRESSSFEASHNEMMESTNRVPSSNSISHSANSSAFLSTPKTSEETAILEESSEKKASPDHEIDSNRSDSNRSIDPMRKSIIISGNIQENPIVRTIPFEDSTIKTDRPSVLVYGSPTEGNILAKVEEILRSRRKK